MRYRLLLAALLLPWAAHAQEGVGQDATGMVAVPASEPVEEITFEDHAPATARKASSPAPVAAPPAIPAPAPLMPEPAIDANTALIQGLKKVTGEVSTFEAPLDVPISFGTLHMLVKKCVKSPPDAPPENAALIQIKDFKPGEPAKVVFSGWMFSSSPAISALEHPVYDMTLKDCMAKKKR